MSTLPSNLVAIGPWCVEARLTVALVTGLPYLSLETGTGEWVADRWKRWEGSEDDARELAATYGGVAVPRRWVLPGVAAAEVVRAGADAVGHPHRPGRHDRTGEVQDD